MATDEHTTNVRSTGANAEHDTERLPIVELRQYTLRAGRRDELVELFEREFIEPQEEAGMRVLGTFCDLDDANRFVWLRAFASMPKRAQALTAFYDGPVWKAHREDANATMIDSDNVLLLRPARAHRHSDGPGWPIEGWRRTTAASHHGGLVIVVCGLSDAPDASFADGFVVAMQPMLACAKGTLAGCFVSETSPNTFPRLPVREGEHVIVWIARLDDIELGRRLATELKASTPWVDSMSAGRHIDFKGPPQVLRLAPTRRSRF